MPTNRVLCIRNDLEKEKGKTNIFKQHGNKKSLTRFFQANWGRGAIYNKKAEVGSLDAKCPHFLNLVATNLTLVATIP